MNISDDIFTLFLHYIETTTGMSQLESNQNSICESINHHCETHHLEPYQYLKQIQSDANAWQCFINDVTIGETYFFREEKHFQILSNYILPELIQQRNKVQIWSAACSSGEEAISIYLLLQDLKKTYPQLDFLVGASDINHQLLQRLQQGIYTKNSFRFDGTNYHFLLEPFHNAGNHCWVIPKSITQSILAKISNVFKENIPPWKMEFDCIFFRNAMIYMSAQARNSIIQRLVASLKPGGYLIVGASEVYMVQDPNLSLQNYNHAYFYKNESKGYAV